MMIYVVRQGEWSCPVGCGEEIVLVKCLPSGRLAGWCCACAVLQPVPMPQGFLFGVDDMEPRRYAPGGLALPEWPEVAAAGLVDEVIRAYSSAEWHGLYYLQNLLKRRRGR